MRVGVIGSGTMGQTHVRAWRTLGVDLALFSEDAAGGRRVAADANAEWAPSLDDLLAMVDVADVCVPTDAHRGVVERAARAGRHVVCEKPLALSVADGEAMIAACEAAGVRLFVAMVLRFFPQYRAARDLVHAGRIGPPRVLRLRRVAGVPYGGTSWYADEARSGGMMLDLMLHDIDYALWCAGDVERVYAKLNASGPRQFAQAVLGHRSGAVSLIEGGWANPNGLFRTALDLAGPDGVIEWTSDAPPAVRTFLEAAPDDAAPDVGLPSGGAQDPFALELGHALDALRTGTPFDVTPDEAIRALRVTLAARESARTGRAVTLEGA